MRFILQKQLIPLTLTGDEYQDEAVKLAQKHGIKMYVLAKAYDLYFPDDLNERWIYKLQLVRGKKNYTFTFGQSTNAGDQVPTYYDVFAALQKYDVGDFDDFLSEFGYEYKPGMYKQYTAVVREYEAVMRLFGDIIDELSEIQ